MGLKIHHLGCVENDVETYSKYSSFDEIYK